VGPGVDAHAFEPTPQDAKALAQADLLITNGLSFESWLPRVVRASGFQGVQVTASSGVREISGDPHAWQDLSNGMIYVANIARALEVADPAHADDYSARARAYEDRLR